MADTPKTDADHDIDRSPNPGKKQEKVEDRTNVSIVTPEDYPKHTRAAGDKA